MTMKRVATVSSAIDATFLQQKLKNHGIMSFRTHEAMTTLLPHFTGLLGHGIQVMVREDDFDKAVSVLNAKQDEVRCAYCGSREIGFGMKGKSRIGEKILIFLSMILTIPVGNVKNKHYCKECGESFELG
jgi:DNA-directed RNA polymerase subunit RPC12/RpoP